MAIVLLVGLTGMEEVCLREIGREGRVIQVRLGHACNLYLSRHPVYYNEHICPRVILTFGGLTKSESH